MSLPRLSHRSREDTLPCQDACLGSSQATTYPCSPDRWGATVDDLDVVAFLDESRKPIRDPQSGRPVASELHYAVAAAMLFRGDLESLRADLVSIARNVGGSLHYADLGPGRRIAALTALGELDGWEGLIYETAVPLSHRIPERRTRARLLGVAFPDLLNRHEVHTITLETRASPQRGFSQLDQHDHSTWQSLVDQGLVPRRRVLTHGDKSEPLLWVADLMAGARTDHLCAVNRGNYAIISHRVTASTPVAG